MAIQIRTSLAEPETAETYVPHRPARPDKAEGGQRFRIVLDYAPAGDQPQANLVWFANSARPPRALSWRPRLVAPSEPRSTAIPF